jgi:hypothetical protein
LSTTTISPSITVYRYIREAITLLAAMAPSLEQAIEVAQKKAFRDPGRHPVRINRVGMFSSQDRAFYSGKHKAHGVNVQVIADPAGRLVWISPALPGARHDMGPPTSTASSRHSTRPRCGGGRSVGLPHRPIRAGATGR